MKILILNLTFITAICGLALTDHRVFAASLSQVIRQCWRNNPQIQGQQTQASLAAGDRWRRFIFNEPQFTVSTTDDSTALSYGLTLSASFPGKTFALAQVDYAKQIQQEAELAGKKQDLAQLIVQSYLDCAGSEVFKQIQRESIQDLSTVLRSLKLLYESGHASQTDMIQAELQFRQAKTDLVALEDKALTSCQKLDQILAVSGVKDRPDLNLPDDLDSNLVAELGKVSGNVRRANSAIQLAQATLSNAWWSQLPDFTFGFQRNHYLYVPGSPSGKEWANNSSLSFTLPLLFMFHESIEAKRTRSQAHIDEGTAELQLAQAKAEEEEGAREYQRSKARLEELREKDLSLAEALRESILSAYRAGKVGFADLVLARKTYSDLKTQEAQLKTSIINAHLRCLSYCTATR